MEEWRVVDVMNPVVTSISDEAELEEAIELLNRHQISALVVVDHSGHMVGVISQTDLLHAWQVCAGDTDVLHHPVSRYMTRDVISCAPQKSLAYALHLLNERKIRRLVVTQTLAGGRFVTDRIKPVGILSQTDIVRALVGRLR